MVRLPALLGFCENCRVHVFQRPGRAVIAKAAENLLRRGLIEDRQRLQDHAITRVFNHHTGSCLPAQFGANRLGKGDLPFGGYSSGQKLELGHERLPQQCK